MLICRPKFPCCTVHEPLLCFCRTTGSDGTPSDFRTQLGWPAIIICARGQTRRAIDIRRQRKIDGVVMSFLFGLELSLRDEFSICWWRRCTCGYYLHSSVEDLRGSSRGGICHLPTRVCRRIKGLTSPVTLQHEKLIRISMPALPHHTLPYEKSPSAAQHISSHLMESCSQWCFVQS
jgi:hypothetical protein